MLNSHYHPLATIQFPAFRARQKYMHAFDIEMPTMPEGFEDYAVSVGTLCRASGVASGRAYMTVDEKVIGAGRPQRRPHPHVDGCFMPDASRWGHPGPGPSWIHADGIQRMSVIVAASVAGCRAWRGEFDAVPDSGGDLSHIAGHLGAGEVLSANLGYLLSPDGIHESLTFTRDTQRSFLRIALPG